MRESLARISFLPQFNSPKSLVKSGVFYCDSTTPSDAAHLAHWQLYSNDLLCRTEAEFPHRTERKLPANEVTARGHIAEEGDNIAFLSVRRRRRSTTPCETCVNSVWFVGR